MNKYSSNCFEKCWHSAGSPCPRFVDCVQQGQQCECGDESAARLERYKRGLLMIEHDIPLILVGLGTCGLANGGQHIFDAIAAECETRGIQVSIIPVGCVGFCAREVIVDVKLPGRPRISYCEVKLQDVTRIVEETLVGGRVIVDKLLGVYSHENAPDWGALPLVSEISFFRKQKKVNLENCGVIDPESIDQYLARGGYAGLSRVLQTRSSQETIDDVLASGLRGRGGGGFPTGKKWQFAHDQNADKKYLICNADEGDPGAFMDRALLEGDPHRVIEGMIIAAYAMGASYGYIYCRAEYPLAIRRLEKTLKEARDYGLLGANILGSGFSFDMRIKKGAGAFVCGEETALINSIEGRRGMPRPRPPFPAVSGLSASRR